MRTVVLQLRLLLLFVPLYFCSSCVGTRNVTQAPLFAQLVQRPLQIRSEVVLCKAERPLYYFVTNVLITKATADYGVNPGPVLCRLKQDSTIFIHDFLQHNYFEGIAYYAIGTIVCENVEYGFVYLYGTMDGAGEISVSRPPWEGDDSPARRVISAETGETLRIVDFERRSPE